MLAIMGPSGAGKSSLLHALGGRILHNSKLSLNGNRHVNGQVLLDNTNSMLPAVALIEQRVEFFPHMTVRETIKFRVDLKIGSLLNKQARNKMVDTLLEQMGLTSAADTIVGNAKVRGISGGELKRLSIAVELIGSPSLIFLDEPTSTC
jgi:ABC-type multidrug transport system ATPase subunit